MLGKFEFSLFFHGLMISDKNINKSNIKLFKFTGSCNYICCSSVFTKIILCLSEICCVLSVFIFPDLSWCWWRIIKQIFYAFFSLISKLFTLGKIIFNCASRRWILITGEYMLIINLLFNDVICIYFSVPFYSRSEAN